MPPTALAKPCDANVAIAYKEAAAPPIIQAHATCFKRCSESTMPVTKKYNTPNCINVAICTALAPGCKANNADTKAVNMKAAIHLFCGTLTTDTLPARSCFNIHEQKVHIANMRKMVTGILGVIASKPSEAIMSKKPT
uniref:Uncharacterized protein n=1 Tax=uncultured Acetothermia bacterium TaxID=236499 RepID=H5SH28_9BACT|nr:hypothetical protein HGMM_F27H04C22 [uncultured Acetothermia bacterium]